MMEKNDYYGYVYKIENIINGKLYVGLHKGVFGEDNYFGSGYALKGAITKYGRDNFVMSLLCTCESRDELVRKEIEMIDSLNSKYPNGYNLTSGGDGLLDPSDDVRKRISDKNKLWFRDESMKTKLRDSITGRRFCNNGTIQRQVSIEEFNELISLGWEEGMLPMEDSQKESIRKALTGKIASDETKRRHSESMKSLWKNGYTGNRGLIFINNGLVNKQVPKDFILEDGWVYGMKPKKARPKGSNGLPAWNVGLMYINNGEINRMVPKNHVLEDGWSYGMKPRGKKS